MSRLLPASLAAAAVLIATIVWEVTDSPTVNPEAPSGRPSAARAGGASPAAETSELVQAWMETALERPLFREDRRPVKTADEPARGGNETLRLTGIITGPFGSRAIFQSGDSARPIVADVKTRLNGFVVRSIEPGKVVVVDAGGDVRTLKPAFAEGDQTPRRAQ